MSLAWDLILYFLGGDDVESFPHVIGHLFLFLGKMSFFSLDDVLGVLHCRASSYSLEKLVPSHLCDLPMFVPIIGLFCHVWRHP